MTRPRTDAIHHHVVVNAPIERAFAVFTTRFGDFKRHIYDRGVDGSVCKWARVLVYEPPSRVLFTWDIGPTWRPETDLAKTSEVEVRFTAQSAETTRVDLEHRHLDRHGPGWESVADGVDSEAGWPLYLRRYTDLLCIQVQP